MDVIDVETPETPTSPGSPGSPEANETPIIQGLGEEKIPNKKVFHELIHMNSGILWMHWIGCLFAILNGFCTPAFAVGFQYATEWLADIEYRNQWRNEQAAAEVGGTTVEPWFDTSKGKMPKTAWDIFFIFVAVGVLMGLFTYLQVWFFHRFGTQVSCLMRTKLYNHLLETEISFHDKNNSNKLNSACVAHCQRINLGMGQQLGVAYQQSGCFVAGFAYAFHVSWQMTLFMAALMPALIIGGYVQAALVSATASGATDEFISADAKSGETFQALQTVQSMNAQHRQYQKYRKNVDKAEASRIYNGYYVGLGIGSFLFCLFGVYYGGCMFYGASRVDMGKISSGDLMGAFFSVMIGGMGLGQVAAAMTDVNKALESGDLLFRILGRDPEVRAPEKDCLIPLTEGIHGEIEFKDLEFFYPTRDEVQIYDQLSLKIKQGDTVAFVGPSGCGKSTIVNLLERFYDPTGTGKDGKLKKDQILLDGNPIHNYDIDYLRTSVSLVSQEPVLFDMTVKENIALGVQRQVTDAEIIAAAKKANAHDFISGFPQQYDTPVGELGSQMSGGQKQRIAIARAVLKQPKVILLDEATSALDTESEQIVQAALDKIIATEHCTCIVIAHRLSTIKNADVIVVLVGGNIAEMGQHEELLDLGGIYADMVEAQNLNPHLPPAALQKQSSMDTLKIEPLTSNSL